MKYHIAKNTVQETLVIPFYARKMCSEHFPGVFSDETAIRLMDEIEATGIPVMMLRGDGQVNPDGVRDYAIEVSLQHKVFGFLPFGAV